MSKIRSDSIWNSLPPERRKMFEDWLFEERVSYKEAMARAKKEWGVTGSKSSVHRFYRRVEADRPVNKLEEMMETAGCVDSADGEQASLKKSAMKLVGMQLLERAIERGGDVRELAALSRVLTQDEDREIQRGRLALAQKKFEFQAAKEMAEQAPLLDKAAQGTQALADEARQAIFGTAPQTDIPRSYAWLRLVTPGYACEKFF